jgi:MFS transporter, OFA family, oxalate/formate antiporter
VDKLIPALLTNIAMGILYTWSLFATALSSLLHVPLSTVDLAPSVALVFFTFGVYLHDSIARASSFRLLASLAFACAGTGHLLFWLWPTPATLLFGYGILFGFGSGLGYGLALSLAVLGRERPGTAVGLVTAAFSLGGLLFAFVFQAISPANAAIIFAVIGAGLYLTGAAITYLIWQPPLQLTSPTKKALQLPNHRLLSTTFIKLVGSFFVLCFVGLMTVSHLTGLLANATVPSQMNYLGPILFNLGYIVGSLAGGRIASATSTSAALVADHALGVLGLALLSFASSTTGAFIGIAMVGLMFGASASVFPLFIGDIYGVASIAKVYGRLMPAYGAAGLTAPWLTAKLFETFGSYNLVVKAATAFAMLGSLIALSLMPRFRSVA